MEGDMETHSNILAWRIPWTEEPGGLQSIGHRASDTAEGSQHACMTMTPFSRCWFYPSSLTARATRGFLFLRSQLNYLLLETQLSVIYFIDYDGGVLITKSCLTLETPSMRFFQTGILEWVAISFSRGSSPPRDQTHRPMSPALQADSLLLRCEGSPLLIIFYPPNLCVYYNSVSVSVPHVVEPAVTKKKVLFTLKFTSYLNKQSPLSVITGALDFLLKLYFIVHTLYSDYETHQLKILLNFFQF